MTDDFSEGWIEFEEFVAELMQRRKLSIKDLDEYVKMYKEREEE